MGESRDVTDPRDELRGMSKEVRAEQEGEEQHDTGGQEHASAAERRGEAASAESPDEAEMDREAARATQDQSDADALAVPRGDPVTGGGGNAGRTEPPFPGEER
jgi:hypothetical protein